MILTEEQSFNLLTEYKLPTKWFFITSNINDLEKIKEWPVVLKIQIPSGKRGKNNGVIIANNINEAKQFFKQWIGNKCQEHLVEKIGVFEYTNIKKEHYISIKFDQTTNNYVIIFNKNGGMNIEETKKGFITIHTHPNDNNIKTKIKTLKKFSLFAYQLLQFVYTNDLVLCEINPLATNNKNKLIICDAKIDIDEESLFRHNNIPVLNKEKYPDLGGNISVISNGAGLCMYTCDCINNSGLKVKRFIDGGSALEYDICGIVEKCNHIENEKAIIVNVFLTYSTITINDIEKLYLNKQTSKYLYINLINYKYDLSTKYPKNIYFDNLSKCIDYVKAK